MGEQKISGQNILALNTENVQGPINITSSNSSGGTAFLSPRRFEKATSRREPVRILFLGANHPSKTLQIDEEVREIDRTLRTAELGDRFEVSLKFAVRISDIEEHLLRHKPQILHFSGHGLEDQGLLLRSEVGRDSPLAPVQLARLLGHFRQHLRCVVLNACNSLATARLIAADIDCVVGMGSTIDDRAAIRFSAGFYRALAYGRDIASAFNLGCSEIEINGLHRSELPQLIASRVNPASLVLVRQES
jgi:CHAT domain